MPSVGDIQNIESMIDQNINQYAVQAFQNQSLRTILLNMCNIISALLSGTTFSYSLPAFVTSANFSDATNCPLPAFNGKSIVIYWNDQNRFLVQGTDYNLLSGGGFQMIIPGFNSADANYTFLVFS